MTRSRSAEVRARLGHPVIDGDGHWLEPVPIFLDYLREVAGPTMVERFVRRATDVPWYALGPDERRARRLIRPTWWGEPAGTLDRATAMIPRLFRERLGELGIDFALVYTSLGLFYVSNPDGDLRRAVARAVNRMNAELFAPYADRMTPAAVVPMHTPEEAIEEATCAVRELGLKVLMIANHVRRPVEASARQVADPATQARIWIDSLGLDSAHDYDPFWARCRELRVAVTAHSGSMGWNGRESVDSFTYNHIGHFANASHAFAKALILGGVTHRFPELRWAFLEGGVGWAVNLLADLLGHWARRRRQALEAQVRPTNLDLDALRDLFVRYGGPRYEAKLAELWQSISCAEPFHTAGDLTRRAYREAFDDFAAVPVASAEALARHFSERFYFGCEADDPMTAWAFDPRGPGRLRPIFSSDVGHFDVPDMSDVLHEAWELVEEGRLAEADLREFVFGNPVRLHTALRPDFFAGTAVQDAVRTELAAASPPTGTCAGTR